MNEIPKAMQSDMLDPKRQIYFMINKFSEARTLLKVLKDEVKP